MFQVEVFCVVTPCNVVVGYQRRPVKRGYPTTTLNGVTTQKTSTQYYITYEVEKALLKNNRINRHE